MLLNIKLARKGWKGYSKIENEKRVALLQKMTKPFSFQKLVFEKSQFVKFASSKIHCIFMKTYNIIKIIWIDQK
jgi:hypothetical protein